MAISTPEIAATLAPTPESEPVTTEGESADLENSGIVAMDGSVSNTRDAPDSVGSTPGQFNVLLAIIVSTYFIWLLQGQRHSCYHRQLPALSFSRPVD